MSRSCVFQVLYVHSDTETSNALKLTFDAHFSDLDVCIIEVIKTNSEMEQSDGEPFLSVQHMMDTQQRDAAIWYSAATGNAYLYIKDYPHQRTLLGEEKLQPDVGTYLETVAFSARFHISAILDEKIQLSELFKDETGPANEPIQKPHGHTRQRLLLGAQKQPVEKKEASRKKSVFLASAGYAFASANKSNIAHGLAFSTGVKINDSLNIMLAAILFGETAYQFTYGDVALKRQRFLLCVERRVSANRLELTPLVGLSLERIKMVPQWSDYIARPGTEPHVDIGAIAGCKGIIWLATNVGMFVQGDVFLTRYKTHFVLMADESVSLSRVRFGLVTGLIVQL